MENIKCEHPVIIFNRASISSILHNCYYVLGSYEKHISARTRDSWQYFFPFQDFSKIAHQVSADELENYYTYDTETGEKVQLFIEVPCGKCEICRAHKSNAWSNRCALESEGFKYLPMFLTLTYANEPVNGVEKDDVKLFMKRLKINLSRAGFSDQIRYVCCGEYGHNTKRAHYHLLLWNLPEEFHFIPHSPKIKTKYLYTQGAIEFIHKSWGLGNIKVMACKDSKASLYITKYMRKEVEVPEGKNKPFWLSSRGTRNNRGAIGYSGLKYHNIIERLRSEPMQNIQYLSRHDNKVKDFFSCRYFTDKIFPSVRQYLGQKMCKVYKNIIDTAPIALKFFNLKMKGFLDKYYIPSTFGYMTDYKYCKHFWFRCSIEDVLKIFVNNLCTLDDYLFSHIINEEKILRLQNKRCLYVSRAMQVTKNQFDIQAELEKLHIQNSRIVEKL